MSKDINQDAARIVKETSGGESVPLPPELEAAWLAWSKGVKKIDSRTMALLRAAFEAGAEASKTK